MIGLANKDVCKTEGAQCQGHGDLGEECGEEPGGEDRKVKEQLFLEINWSRFHGTLHRKLSEKTQ